MIPSGVLCLFHGRGPQDNGCVPWYLPVLHGIKRRGATAAIARVLAGPRVCHSLSSGGASNGSGAGIRGRSRPRFTISSLSLPCAPKKRSTMLLDRAPRHPCRQGAAPHARRGPGVADGAGRGATHRSPCGAGAQRGRASSARTCGVFRVRQACLHRRVVQAAKL